ncbi:MAG: citrate lyase holo-[acyl-carrier protein] synthase [bacterium]|nr:citrate lyase holo-[acyl-carrier protein] synthase [bacterium]
MDSIDKILEDKTRLDQLQNQLSQQYPCNVTVQLTLNIPGPAKKHTPASGLFDTGLPALEELLNRDGSRVRKKTVITDWTFYAALFSVSGDNDGGTLKRNSTALETLHPLGRFWDIDVYFKQKKISREDIGEANRTCFLCDRPAKVCAFMGTHTNQEMLSFIKREFINY